MAFFLGREKILEDEATAKKRLLGALGYLTNLYIEKGLSAEDALHKAINSTDDEIMRAADEAERGAAAVVSDPAFAEKKPLLKSSLSLRMFTQRDKLREAFDQATSGNKHNEKSRDNINAYLSYALGSVIALYVLIPLFAGQYDSIDKVSGHIMPIITLLAGFFGAAVGYYYGKEKSK